MAKAKVSVDSLVKDALLTLATSTEPMRLSGKGDAPALFASAAGANKDAIAQLEADALVRTVGTGKAATVKLTAAGFARVLPSIPEEKVGGLAMELAADIPTAAARVEFLQQIVGRTPLATAELLPILEETRAAEQTETALRLAAAAERRAAEEASLQAIERWKSLIDERRKDRVDALRRELAVEGAADGVATPQAANAPMPKATTPEEKDFRRNVARRLVSAWMESVKLNKAEARQFLEVAIGNIDGIEQIADEGERVTFDGTFHRCESGVSTGAGVTVVRPGWKLQEERTEYVIEKALVAS